MIRACSIMLLPLLAGVIQSAAAYESRVQLWQVSGYPLMDLSELSQSAFADGAARGVPLRNPALLSDDGSFGIGWLHQAQTGDAENTDRDPVSRSKQGLPQALGLSGSCGIFGASLGYEQLYNSHRLVIPEATVGLPVPRDWDSRLDAYTLQVALSPFRFGSLELRAGGGMQRVDLVMDQDDLQDQITDYRYQTGIQLQGDRFSLAFGWESEVTWNMLLVPPATSDSLQVWGRLPETLHLQAAVRPGAGIELELLLHQLDWSRQQLHFKDQLEYTLKAHLAGPRGLVFHGGISSSGSESEFYASWASGEYSTWFLLVGMTASLGPVELDLQLADSHFGSGEWRKQTILQAALRMQVSPPFLD